MQAKETLTSLKQASTHIRCICSKYGLHGGVFNYMPCTVATSDRNRVYMVAGTNPDLDSENLPTWVYPDAVLRMLARNNRLFYPNIWAFDMTGTKNDMKAAESLVEYLKKAEFLRDLYAEYGMTPPNRIRISEVHQLIDFCAMRDDPLTEEHVRDHCRKELNWFFRRERAKGFRRKWLAYYRSEHFPDNKGPITKLSGYFRGNTQRTSYRQLLECNQDIHTLEMQEHEFAPFCQFLSQVYPDVVYAVGDKEIVNHGGIGNQKGSDDVSGRRVTGEEFAAVCKEHFAEEGWDALSDLKPAYWEFRDVYYRACDEPLVAAAYNSIVLQFAKCDPLAELAKPVAIVDVPAADFMNFVSLAKANQLRFYIDNAGDFATPSLETVHVVYGEHQKDKLHGILTRMVNDKVDHSHVLPYQHRPALSSIIHETKRHRTASESNRITVTDRDRC